MTNAEAADYLESGQYHAQKNWDAIALAVDVLRGGHGERRSGVQRRQREGELRDRVKYDPYAKPRRYAYSLYKGRREEDQK